MMNKHGEAVRIAKKVPAPAVAALAFLLAGCVGTTSALQGVGTQQAVAESTSAPVVLTADPAGDVQPLDVASDETIAPQDADAPDDGKKRGKKKEPRQPGIVSLSYQAQEAERRANMPPPPPRQGFDPVETPEAPQMSDTREGALAEIRAKADAGRNGQRPDIFTEMDSSTPHLTEGEQKRLERELRAMAKENSQEVDPKEAAARPAASKRLLRQASDHYKRAVAEIEQ
jgi:hypothetical protein